MKILICNLQNRYKKNWTILALFSVVAPEDGRPAENQGPVRRESRLSAFRKPELAAERVQHPEIELHEAEEAASAVQAAQNRIRLARHWS